MPSFLVLRLRHTYAGSPLNRGLKKQISSKKWSCFAKNILFKLNLSDEGHLNSDFSIYILTLFLDLFPDFLSRGIHMGIPILTEVQKGHISGKKSPHNLLKNVLLKLYYQHEGHWFGNSLFYISTVYRKCVFFSVRLLWIMCADSHLKRASKKTN